MVPKYGTIGMAVFLTPERTNLRSSLIFALPMTLGRGLLGTVQSQAARERFSSEPLNLPAEEAASNSRVVAELVPINPARNATGGFGWFRCFGTLIEPAGLRAPAGLLAGDRC